MNPFKRAWLSAATTPRVPGLFNSVEEASCSYLASELTGRGIPPSIIPSAGIREIVDERLKIARFAEQRGSFDLYGVRQDIQQLMALSLDDDVDRITELLTGKTDRREDSIGIERRRYLADLLTKHGVRVYRN